MKANKIIFVLLTVVQAICMAQSAKINGISFVASRFEVKQENVDPVLDVNANYATVMPFGFIRSIELPNISYNSNNQWFGETEAGVKQYIEILQKKWLKGNDETSNLDFTW